MFKKLFVFPYKTRFILLLALITGVMSILISPPFNLFFLGFFMFILGLFLFHPENRAKLKYRHFFLFGWVSGLIMMLGNFYWVYHTIQLFGQLPAFASAMLFIGYCSYISIKVGLMYLIPAFLKKRYNYPILIGLIVSFFFLESCFPEEFLFYFGNAQLYQRYFVQIADIIGVQGITLLVLIINYLLYNFIVTRQKKMLSMVLIIFFVTYSYSFLRYLQILSLKHVKHGYTTIKVGIIQPNEPFSTNLNEIQSYIDKIKTMTDTLRNRKDISLIIWPESAIPIDLKDPTPYNKEFVSYIHNFPIPILYNAPTEHTDMATGKTQFFSDAILNIPGKPEQHYSKIMLLPFGEFLPFESTFPKLRTWLPTSGDFTRGKEIKNFVLNDKITISPQICYEITLPYFTRKFVAKKSNLIINITNDKWFGETIASELHMWEASFRAIENRVPIVRATNSGISGVIDITGKTISKRSKLMSQAIMVVDVPIYDKITSFFSLFGDLPLMLFITYLAIRGFFYKGVKRPYLLHIISRKKTKVS